MDAVLSMRISAVLIAFAAVVATPNPASADVSAAQNPVALGFDLNAATIPDLQQRMDHGRLTSVRLTVAYLRRIDAIDGKIHSVISLNPRALAEAAASDARHRAGRTLSPLDGIPVLLVDTNQVIAISRWQTREYSTPGSSEKRAREDAVGTLQLGQRIVRTLDYGA